MPRREIIDDPRRMKVAPIEFAGQWVAWNKDRSKIIANGNDVAAVRAAAIAAGEEHALLEKVHLPDRIHIGLLCDSLIDRPSRSQQKRAIRF